MRTLDWIALVLMIIGGLFWGIVALFGYNPFGGLSTIPAFWQVIFALVGIAGIYTMVSALIKLDQCTYYPTETVSTRV